MDMDLSDLSDEDDLSNLAAVEGEDFKPKLAPTMDVILEEDSLTERQIEDILDREMEAIADKKHKAAWLK